LRVLTLITLGGCAICALVDTQLYLLSDLPKDSDGVIIVDQMTLPLVKSGARFVDQRGTPFRSQLGAPGRRSRRAQAFCSR